MYGTELKHSDLRQQACKLLNDNKEIYKFYIEDDVSIEDYIEEMAKDGVWGGQLEMTVLSDQLKFNVIVH